MLEVEEFYQNGVNNDERMRIWKWLLGTACNVHCNIQLILITFTVYFVGLLARLSQTIRGNAALKLYILQE